MEIRPFDRMHMPEIVDCVTAVWTEGNVIANALGVTAQEYRPVAQQVCDKALDDELGLMLIDPETDAVMGFHTSIDLVDELDAEAAKSEGASDRMGRWAGLLLRGHRWFLDAHYGGAPPARGEVFYMNIGGTVPELRSSGWINRMLIASLTRFALPRGYEWMLGIATHPHSVRKSRTAAIGSMLYEIPFAELDDPALSRITEPDAIVVSATPLGPLRSSFG